MTSTDTAHAIEPWSWSRLLADCDGDIDRALARLSDKEGLGEYEDRVHRRAPARGKRQPKAPR